MGLRSKGKIKKAVDFLAFEVLNHAPRCSNPNHPSHIHICFYTIFPFLEHSVMLWRKNVNWIISTGWFHQRNISMCSYILFSKCKQIQNVMRVNVILRHFWNFLQCIIIMYVYKNKQQTSFKTFVRREIW